MNIIKPSFIFLDEIDGQAMLKKLEYIGRKCYQSEGNITEDSAPDFLRRIIKRGHESVLEHEKVTVEIVCDRGVSHEIVRHRIASYTQESTRYCNYAKDKFGRELTFIKPLFWDENSEEYKSWLSIMGMVESTYINLIDSGAQPQQARSVLPNSLKTSIVVTMNIRSWRNFFKLRTAPGAHPQMIEIASIMLDEFKDKISVLFDDIL